jgi:hypothetical protein
MDFFWLIPFAIVALAFLWVFYALISKHPSGPSEPHVLLDKTGAPAVDENVKARDWTRRPCGSFLDWLYGRGK